MTRFICLGVLTGLVLMNFTAAADLPFTDKERQTYLESVIHALQSTPKSSINELEEFVGLSRREKCRSFIESTTLRCLQSEIQRNCETGSGHAIKSCAVLSDALLVNKMNENKFISRETRFDISESSANFQKAYAKALNTKFGLLATQMLLLSKSSCQDSDSRCLAKEIDQYCSANSDGKSLPWQACAVAIISFIQ